MHTPAFSACIQACNACALACEHCATACLDEPQVAQMRRCISLDRDCADLCRLAAMLIGHHRHRKERHAGDHRGGIHRCTPSGKCGEALEQQAGKGVHQTGAVGDVDVVVRVVAAAHLGVFPHPGEQAIKEEQAGGGQRQVLCERQGRGHGQAPGRLNKAAMVSWICATASSWDDVGCSKWLMVRRTETSMARVRAAGLWCSP